MEILPSLLSFIDSQVRKFKRKISDAAENPGGVAEQVVDNAISFRDEPWFTDPELRKRYNNDMALYIKDNLTGGKPLVSGPLMDQLKDPANFIGGGAAGAFRPSASRLLPSSLTELSNRTTTILNDNLPRPGFRDFRTPEELAEDIVLAKMIAPKELQKYGAPEFQADPFLPHVRNPERNPPAALAEHYPLSDLINDYRSQEVLRKNASRASAYTEAKDYPPFMPYLEKDDKRMMETLDLYPRLGGDARAFMGQLKDKKPLFKLQYAEAKNEILDTSAAIARILTTAGHTPEQLSKKTLQQLVGLAQKEERAILEKQAKSIQTLTEHTVRRTVELQTKQKLPPESKGLVQLENEKDLATETAFQNICCGAGRVDQSTMKYVPAWDPITGKREPGLGTVPVSGDNFFGRVKSGESLMFSYRPNGIPEATIELNAKNGSIREIAGKNNDPMDPKLKDAVLKALAPIQNNISTKLMSGIKMTGNAAADARINEYLENARLFPDEADDFIRFARGIANHRGEFDAEGYAILPR